MSPQGYAPTLRLERYPGRGPAVRLVHGDGPGALEALDGTPPRLVYIDPPFATDREFSLAHRLPDELGGHEVERVAYSDRWGELDAYLAFMDGVLAAVERALHPDGSLLLHCDHRAAHWLAVQCDRRFGPGARGVDGNAPGFRNELVWRYGLGGSSARAWPRKHDTILWYTRSARWTFHPPMVPATSHRMRGQLKKAPDVIDVPALNNLAAERTGYPTQKPLALLELLIGAHTDPDDAVADVFCGSGTTGEAAWRLGRPALLADVGDDAVATTRARLVRAGAAVDIVRTGVGAPSDGVVTVERDGDGARIDGASDAPLVFVATGHLDDGVFSATALPCVAHRTPAGTLDGARSSVRYDDADAWVLWRDVLGREGLACASAGARLQD